MSINHRLGIVPQLLHLRVHPSAAEFGDRNLLASGFGAHGFPVRQVHEDRHLFAKRAGHWGMAEGSGLRAENEEPFGWSRSTSGAMRRGCRCGLVSCQVVSRSIVAARWATGWPRFRHLIRVIPFPVPCERRRRHAIFPAKAYLANHVFLPVQFNVRMMRCRHVVAPVVSVMHQRPARSFRWGHECFASQTNESESGGDLPVAKARPAFPNSVTSLSLGFLAHSSLISGSSPVDPDDSRTYTHVRVENCRAD